MPSCISGLVSINVSHFLSLLRTILEEVTQELSEKNERWRNIEMLAGCDIMKNAGLHTLELMLRPQLNGRPHSTYAPSIGRKMSMSTPTPTPTPPL